VPAITGNVPGEGDQDLAYVIPTSGLDVEAVYATIDASGASGPVTVTLTITDQSGQTIATKVQESTIDSGVVGSATWALGIPKAASSGGGGGLTVTGVQFGQSGGTTTVNNGLSRFIEASGTVSGPGFFLFAGLTNICQIAGVYAILANFQLWTTPWTPGGGVRCALAGPAVGLEAFQWLTLPTVAAPANPQTVVVPLALPPQAFAAGDTFSTTVENNDGAFSLGWRMQSVWVVGYS